MSNPGASPKCNGCKLKCKGNPASKEMKAIPKEQERLLGPAIPTISCSDTLDSLSLQTKGDPGSVFTFVCPRGCQEGGLLVGSGLYSSSSSVCKAAIQSGVLTNTEMGFASIALGYLRLKLTGGKDSNDNESEN
mmetsp:Transcript_60213/g.51010  ORF Transcript_60213/g.51010 Transcript_60213/m.51010 type:complete len:134 (-) Transcript_60213:125-526(-)